MSDAGELLQVIAPSLTIDLPVEDISHVPQEERTEQTRRLAMEQAARAFDLAERPPFRLRLLRLSDTEHVLLVCAHHVIADGWSLDVLASEVAQIYDAFSAERPSPLPELTVQYADYAVWQRNYMQGEVLDSLLNYWRTKLDGFAPVELPTDRPRRVGVQHAQRAYTFQLPHRLKVRLNRLCSAASVTPYMLFLAAFQALLHRYTDATDIAVGSPSANRQQPETHNMIGVFINTLVMRNDLSGDPSFRELLARVSRTAIEAYEHQEMRFERLAKELAPGHDLTKQPLVQILFSYHQATSSQRLARRRELTVGFQETHLALQAAEVFDLTMAVADADQGFSGQVAYDETLFDDETIIKLAAHFQSLLEAVALDPDQRLSQLPLLSDAERSQVLVEWNATHLESAEPTCVHQLFETWAQRQPDAVALSCPAKQ